MEEKYLDNLYNTINPEIALCDFDKVQNNTKELEECCEKLNHILLIDNKKDYLQKLVETNPKEMLKIILLCLGLRDDKKIYYFFDLEKQIENKYDFNQINPTKVWELCEKTGFISFLETNKIKDFYSYILGVEIGLDTNARKNRYGKQMALLIENILSNDENIHNLETEVNKIRPWMEHYLNEEEKEYIINKKKRFDFAFLYDEKIYFVEVNFYTSSGSKLNEVAKSYQKINNEFINFKNVEFIWITDGVGWKNAKKDLNMAIENNKYLFFLDDIKNQDYKITRLLD